MNQELIVIKEELNGVRNSLNRIIDKIQDAIDNCTNVAPVIFPNEPIASGLSDLITAKQLGMIRAVSRNAGINAEEECMQLLNCSTSELSKKAASSFIDHLLKMQKAQQERNTLSNLKKS